MPKMNSESAAMNVGRNHLRSFGFSAGRKNAKICHSVMGAVAISAVHSATVMRTENASKAPSTFRATWPSSPLGMNSATGASRNCTTVPVER